MIRRARIEDIESIVRLIQDTIRKVNSKDYRPEQISAWTERLEHPERWALRIREQYFLLEVDKNILRGCCSLDTSGYVDVLYVHKDHQHQGIAKNLYLEMEQNARERQLVQLSSDVSITARAFFEKMGFKVVKKQCVRINGVTLTNFRMTKPLKNAK